MSALVVFEVVTPTEVSCRAQAIEKWTAVADICRCLHNFNGVLQICSAFTSASAFRLKSTWAKISKSVSLVLKICFFQQNKYKKLVILVEYLKVEFFRSVFKHFC